MFVFSKPWTSYCQISKRKRINVQKMKASVHMKPFVRWHCCCRLHLWLLVLQKLEKTKGNKFQTFSVSGLFFLKRHPTKYMHIEKKNLTEKTSVCSKSEVKLACNLLRGRFLASRLYVTTKKNGRRRRLQVWYQLLLIRILFGHVFKDCIVTAKQTAYLKAFRLLWTFSPKF